MDHRPSDHAIAAVLRPTLEVHRLPPVHDPRYEVKFTADARDLLALQRWLRTHAAGWTVAFPDRTVCNVYFDTPGLDAYEDNQAGISERRKLRLRWYGETWQTLDATLEVKCRSGGVGWKWNAAVAGPIDLERMTWQQFRDVVRAELPPTHRFLLDGQPLAALVNRYRRAYYVSRDGRIRLTVDRDITFLPQLGRMRPALRHAAHRAQAVVIEVKCAVADKNLAAEVLKDFPWRTTRHSKYALGIESLENL